jgi:hypothetical protein
MAKFFNEMAELCLQQLSQGDAPNEKHRTMLNRETARNFDSNKRL